MFEYMSQDGFLNKSEIEVGEFLDQLIDKDFAMGDHKE